MTESKGKQKAKPAKQLLSLKPEQEQAFKKKVQGVKKFKKTGGSKGYAFVEFASDEVAKIVAETMNNYLIGEKLIKCHVITPEKTHEKLFDGSQRIFKKPSKPAVTRYNKKRSSEQVTKMTNKLLRKEESLRKRLAAKGIDYDFPGFAAHVSLKKSASLNLSADCDDTTPMCTPSFMEKRKITVNDDNEDDEIIIKMPSVQMDECSFLEEEDEENNDSKEEKICKADEVTEVDV